MICDNMLAGCSHCRIITVVIAPKNASLYAILGLCCACMGKLFKEKNYVIFSLSLL